MAQCLPGAELTEDKGGGAYAGKVVTKLGMVTAAFEGEMQVTANEATRTGHVEGKGVDRRNASRGRMALDYKLTEEDGGTLVSVETDLVLSGTLAQMGRTGIIKEASNIIVRDFVSCLKQKLAAGSLTEAESVGAKELNAGSLAIQTLISLIRNLFARLIGRS